MEPWQKFFQCDCGTEGVMLSKEWEDEDIPLIYMAYWSEGRVKEKLSFFQRLRWSWKILMSGQVWHDMVVLNKKTAQELGIALLEWARKPEREKK